MFGAPIRVRAGRAGGQRPRRHVAAAAAGLVTAGLVAGPAGIASATTLTVCAQGCAYSQIQPAVDAASAGDTITVGRGTYAGGIVIAKALTLSGDGADATVIRVAGRW